MTAANETQDDTWAKNTIMEARAHADGTITLCEVCADTWREYETVVISRLRLLEEAIERLRGCGSISQEHLEGFVESVIAACDPPQPAPAPKAIAPDKLHALCVEAAREAVADARRSLFGVAPPAPAPVIDDEHGLPVGECSHTSWTGDEGPVEVLGRMPRRWKCDGCGVIKTDPPAPDHATTVYDLSIGRDVKVSCPPAPVAVDGESVEGRS